MAVVRKFVGQEIMTEEFRCKDCDGYGVIDRRPDKECPSCHGTGLSQDTPPRGSDLHQDVTLSPEEAQPGRHLSVDLTSKPISVVVEMPPDVRDGSVIRLVGMGARGGGGSGDLYLRINVHRPGAIVGGDVVEKEPRAESTSLPFDRRDNPVIYPAAREPRHGGSSNTSPSARDEVVSVGTINFTYRANPFQGLLVLLVVLGCMTGLGVLLWPIVGPLGAMFGFGLGLWAAWKMGQGEEQARQRLLVEQQLVKKRIQSGDGWQCAACHRDRSPDDWVDVCPNGHAVCDSCVVTASMLPTCPLCRVKVV